MSINEEISDKKRALIAYKNKLLNDIHYCEKRVEEISKKRTQTYYDDEDSSDSDTGILLPVKGGPTAHQLREETSQLNLCLQATQELTSLQVLESEVNVLVDPPKLNDGNYPEEEGVWREALAECKVDLIPYCITFYIFQPSKRFGSPSYYQLRVIPTKSNHEKELGNSILSKLTRPSDAWQVLKNYSLASRSRRKTMARLGDKFGDAIVAGPAEEGGFTIKCANLLEISWSLQNIWSPVMPFQHKMKFDLEYMDEHYIKTIKHAHKQLSDPSLEADERTDILTKILNTCIEASGNISSVTESETDQSVHLTPVKRRTTLEEEPVIPVKRRTLNKGDTESVMPPPKGVPKKNKAKDKENVNSNRNGLELQEQEGSSKSKDLIKENNKDGNSKTTDKHLNRNVKSNGNGVSKDKAIDNVKDNGKAKTKEIENEKKYTNNVNKNKELTEATKPKADKQVKDSEITTVNKPNKNSRPKENNANVDNAVNKKTAATKTNNRTEKPNENRKQTSASHETENDKLPETKENRPKTSERQPKLKENLPNTKDNRQKVTDSNTDRNENENKPKEKQMQKENRQKQSETQQKPTVNLHKANENRHKANENQRKPNANDKQNDKGKNDTKKQDKLNTVSKIPKLFRDNFKPQNFISNRLSGRIEKNTNNDKEKKYNDFEKKRINKDSSKQSDMKNINKKSEGAKQSNNFGIKDKYRLISKSKVLPSSGNLRKQ